MASDIGESSESNSNSNSNSGTEIQNTVDELTVFKIDPLDYIEILKSEHKVKLAQEEAKFLHREITLRKFSQRVAQLESEKAVREWKDSKMGVEIIKASHKKTMEEISEKLGVKSLDEYLINDITMELVHENNTSGIKLDDEKTE